MYLPTYSVIRTVTGLELLVEVSSTDTWERVLEIPGRYGIFTQALLDEMLEANREHLPQFER